MHQFSPFISELDNILIASVKDFPANENVVSPLLDGRPSKELRNHVPLDNLRKSGAFFTGNMLSKIAISGVFTQTITEKSVFLDPTCGGGDLLLACTPYLSVSPDLFETLDQWQARLLGIDIHPEFVDVTKRRLALKAITLGASTKDLSVNSFSLFFNGIRVGSLFNNLDAIKLATHILINPPFFMMPTPESCKWASGKINAASVFLETCVTQANQGTRIVAILPDVLRSGYRYQKWRKLIESKVEINRINLYGQFDPLTDVDVFVLEMVVNNEPKIHSSRWVDLQIKEQETVGDKFDISIGPVVDYRDPHEGPILKYIHPRGLPAWENVNEIKKTRAFKGRTFQSPFVVVRRTSRQSDKYRAIATIIETDDNVAIENHLIVLKPKDGELSTCHDLLHNLKDERTNSWINETIRCRHLTINSLANLPWWSG